MLICAVKYLPVQENIYLFKVNNRNSRKRCEICSKITKTHNDVNDDVIKSIHHNFKGSSLIFASNKKNLS